MVTFLSINCSTIINLLLVMEAGVQFPPKPSKSKIFCCVFGCYSKACRNPELSFHHFPKAGKLQIKHVNELGQSEMIDRRKLWERILKMGKKVTQSMRVCSLHFVKYDYSVFTRPGKLLFSYFLSNY